MPDGLALYVDPDRLRLCLTMLRSADQSARLRAMTVLLRLRTLQIWLDQRDRANGAASVNTFNDRSPHPT